MAIIATCSILVSLKNLDFGSLVFGPLYVCTSRRKTIGLRESEHKYDDICVNNLWAKRARSEGLKTLHATKAVAAPKC